MIKIYGLTNCDRCRQAVKDLKVAFVEYQFHDFRKNGLNPDKLETWLKAVDYKLLLNKRSTTWRELSEKNKENLNDRKAVHLMIQFPALIKRPVFEVGEKIVIGYTENEKKALGL